MCLGIVTFCFLTQSIVLNNLIMFYWDFAEDSLVLVALFFPIRRK